MTPMLNRKLVDISGINVETDEETGRAKPETVSSGSSVNDDATHDVVLVRMRVEEELVDEDGYEEYENVIHKLYDYKTVTARQKEQWLGDENVDVIRLDSESLFDVFEHIVAEGGR